MAVTNTNQWTQESLIECLDRIQWEHSDLRLTNQPKCIRLFLALRGPNEVGPRCRDATPHPIRTRLNIDTALPIPESQSANRQVCTTFPVVARGHEIFGPSR